MKRTFLLAVPLLLFISGWANPPSSHFWPEIKPENRPWTRWWWMGSAVDQANLSVLLAEYAKAGLGGVEITPIYGAVGFEKNYLSYLSPEWMKMLDFTVKEAGKNHLGVDMNLGTGWPFGGPQVTPQAAASKLILQKYSLQNGKQLPEKIIPADPRQQEAGALLQAVTAYGPNGRIQDLTSLVDAAGNLNWTAETGDWEIYAAFCGKTLQKVKRAAPGGEGLTFDHFSKEALEQYLARFDAAFGKNSHGVESFFNDSYEVYGTNWTPSFLDEFQKRRGYALQPYLRELTEKIPSTEISRRVQCDYRETISDLLLDNFTRPWTDWAHRLGSRTRNQAHGSPGNLLDLYAAVDIPECETFGSSYFPIPGLRRDSADIRNVDPDPVMLKFASSAAHVSGKNLVSCETFTWLAEHFRVSLSQCKPEVEQAFLSGVNHVFYHGTAYSPAEAGWPGWLFYASVNFAPSNSFWPHLRGLNDYIARCQSVLQNGVPHNDLLVYWPVYDVWMTPENADLQLTVHSIDRWLHPTPFYQNVKQWLAEGYSFDFISDRLLNNISVKNGELVTASGSVYRTLVIPSCRYLPETTLRRIVELAGQGALVIFQQFPEDIPGMTNLDARRRQQQEILKNLSFADLSKGMKVAPAGSGQIVLSEQVGTALEWKKIPGEKLVGSGLKFLRRKSDEGVYYYLVNHTPEAVDNFLPFNENGRTCLLLDPQTGSAGTAQTRKENGKTNVRIQLQPGEALFVLVSPLKKKAESWRYREKTATPLELNGPWKLTFTEGGATLPAATELTRLVSWTALPEPAASFSGTARYATTFELTGKPAAEYLLDLGKVCESARVWVNGHDAGLVWSIPFTARIGKFLKKGTNTIEIEVANLMANRIRQMDQQKTEWRNYHEINFVNINYKSFDASGWEPMPSGLLGPVRIVPFN